MDKNNLIKDTLIFGNIIDLMRKATNKTIAMCSDIIEDTEGDIKTGSDFYAVTLSSMLGLPTESPEVPSEEVEDAEPTEPEEKEDAE